MPTESGEPAEHTCAAGQLCMPAPGGYCTTFCGATGVACPAGSVCLPSVRGGEACAAAARPTRTAARSKGYICDPGRKACSLPFMASLTLPTCPAAAPPAGDFTPPVELSTKAMPGDLPVRAGRGAAPAGDLVVVYTSGGPMFGKSFLGVARVPRVARRRRRRRRR